ncbi:MAG: hypothetical protein LBH77_00825 [Tannerella sp.]|jgi:hypothetical protein|nr:hypothetical protein [Tannerella sp.]
MKLTSKIILGIILSIFFVSLLFIISFSFTERKNFRPSNVGNIHLPQENQTGIELDTFHVIKIDKEAFDSKEYSISPGDLCELYFDSIRDQNKPDMLFIPEALKDFVSVDTSKDTLNIKLNLWDLCRKYKSDEYNYYSISGINLHFIISKINVINELQELSVKIKNIETDSIKIDSRGDVRIDSCKVGVIEPVVRTDRRRLTIENCIARTINLDLDYMKNWDIGENCTICEENFTGSKDYHVTIHKNEAGKINWLPKNKEAKLNFTIQGDTTQIQIR